MALKEGAIPIKNGNNITFKKDSEGNKVLSKGNKVVKITDKANGKINIQILWKVPLFLDTINEMEKEFKSILF